MDRQVYVIKTVAYSLRTDIHTDNTDTGTDKSLKTEGPKILSNDIFYFRTMIIGGPTDITHRIWNYGFLICGKRLNSLYPYQSTKK